MLKVGRSFAVDLIHLELLVNIMPRRQRSCESGFRIKDFWPEYRCKIELSVVSFLA